MLNYTPNGRRRLGRPLKRLLSCPYTYESGLRVRLGELDSGARLGYISPHTHEWIPKLCSYISVSRMSSSKQVAAAVIILDECGVCGRKRKSRKRRELWAKKWLLGRDRFTHFNFLNFTEITVLKTTKTT